jgi:4-diphosphocytidyl-2-C-methyl-D-erythritol kinase
MMVTVRSFAKVNLGLCIGALRADGFHELCTVYQTIALHDVLRVHVAKGSGIEIRCTDPRVPKDKTNTCWQTIELAMAALSAKGRVIVDIEKRLPVQGGLGGASSNAVAAMLALERALKKSVPADQKLRIAAQVGSDLPLFLMGGTVLGVGRGEEVYPLPDLPSVHCVLATPEIGVSTPKAFADWDAMTSDQAELRSAAQTRTSGPTSSSAKLTLSTQSDRMIQFGRRVSSWLSGSTGVPARGRGRAETPLLDLVRTGIENDFEKVVFPKYPELREVKRALQRVGAIYTSLSGSGSAVYGLFGSRVAAGKAASRLRKQGIPAQATTTLTRKECWKKILIVDF